MIVPRRARMMMMMMIRGIRVAAKRKLKKCENNCEKSRMCTSVSTQFFSRGGAYSALCSKLDSRSVGKDECRRPPEASGMRGATTTMRIDQNRRGGRTFVKSGTCLVSRATPAYTKAIGSYYVSCSSHLNLKMKERKEGR
jgi:hypothetical protein